LDDVAASRGAPSEALEVSPQGHRSAVSVGSTPWGIVDGVVPTGLNTASGFYSGQ
jgi:hypothetical protein